MKIIFIVAISLIGLNIAAIAKEGDVQPRKSLVYAEGTVPLGVVPAVVNGMFGEPDIDSINHKLYFLTKKEVNLLDKTGNKGCVIFYFEQTKLVRVQVLIGKEYKLPKLNNEVR